MCSPIIDQSDMAALKASKSTNVSYFDGHDKEGQVVTEDKTGTRMPKRATVMAMKFDAGGVLSVLPAKERACMATADKRGDGGDSDEDAGDGDGDGCGEG